MSGGKRVHGQDCYNGSCPTCKRCYSVACFSTGRLFETESWYDSVTSAPRSTTLAAIGHAGTVHSSLRQSKTVEALNRLPQWLHSLRVKRLRELTWSNSRVYPGTQQQEPVMTSRACFEPRLPLTVLDLRPFILTVPDCTDNPHMSSQSRRQVHTSRVETSLFHLSSALCHGIKASMNFEVLHPNNLWTIQTWINHFD